MTLNKILTQYFNLSDINYNSENITPTSIYAFNLSVKSDNDKNNKMREAIIAGIINNKIPDEYYIINKWSKLKKNIFDFILKLSSKPYNEIKCIHKGGRKHNYDFNIILYYEDGSDEMFNIELKFNASSIESAPQFVSPMKPSQYMTNSYEEYFYDKYLILLSLASGFEFPTKEEYLDKIHSTNPNCMKEYQDLYYQGCKSSSQFQNTEDAINFYEYSKRITEESITSFIKDNELNIELLSDYLYNSQKNKIYMLYSNNEFILQNVNMDDYKLESVIKDNNRYKCLSKSGKSINVLLRWKNGNGIAFPAFQIDEKEKKIVIKKEKKIVIKKEKKI